MSWRGQLAALQAHVHSHQINDSFQLSSFVALSLMRCAGGSLLQAAAQGRETSQTVLVQAVLLLSSSRLPCRLMPRPTVPRFDQSIMSPGYFTDCGPAHPYLGGCPGGVAAQYHIQGHQPGILQSQPWLLFMSGRLPCNCPPTEPQAEQQSIHPGALENHAILYTSFKQKLSERIQAVPGGLCWWAPPGCPAGSRPEPPARLRAVWEHRTAASGARRGPASWRGGWGGA